MSSLNKVMIIGNLGRDPEITYTQSGACIAKISVATSEKWIDKATGEKREETEWNRIVFFGKQAETIGQYMTKGSQIYVEGRLKTSSYEKDGSTRYSTDIIGNIFKFMGSNQQQQAAPQQQGGGFQQQAPAQQYNKTQPNNNQQGGFQQQQPNNNGGFQQPPNNGGFQQQPQNNGGGFQQPDNSNQGGGFQGRPDDDIPF
jgi:single-strand DNA-binding protein